MKNKRELAILKEEAKTVNDKAVELSEEYLEQVTGGWVHDIRNKLDIEDELDTSKYYAAESE